MMKSLRKLNYTAAARRTWSLAAARGASTAAVCPFSGAQAPPNDGSGKPLSECTKIGLFRVLRNSAKNPYDMPAPVHEISGPVTRFTMVGQGESVMVTDPKEWMKVLKAEGSHPFGTTMILWPSIAVLKRINDPMKDMMTQGAEWKQLRTHLQAGLLSPSAVKGYTAGMCRAADFASKDFPRGVAQRKLEKFFNRASFDMFCSVAFGHQMRSTSEDAPPEVKKFSEDTSAVVGHLGKMLFNPFEAFLHKMGVVSKQSKALEKMIIENRDYPEKLVRDFLKRRNAGELNEEEKNSYIAQNLSSWEEKGDELDVQQQVATCNFLLQASVDNTSTVLRWNLLNLAFEPEVQRKVREELREHGIVRGGSSDTLAEVLNSGKSSLPYLNAVIRENYRMFPLGNMPMMRKLNQDIELGGYNVPAGMNLMFNIRQAQMDPANVPDCNDFRPERWFPEEVEARKGTPAEVIDHILMRDNFSKGARMCPAARVATQEIQAMLATIIRDWDVSIAPEQKCGHNEHGTLLEMSSIWDVKPVQFMAIIPQMPKLVVKPVEQ